MCVVSSLSCLSQIVKVSPSVCKGLLGRRCPRLKEDGGNYARTKLKEILATFPGSGTLPLAAEVPVEKLEAEIQALSEDALLVEAGELVAYCCEPREIQIYYGRLELCES